MVNLVDTNNLNEFGDDISTGYIPLAFGIVAFIDGILMPSSFPHTDKYFYSQTLSPIDAAPSYIRTL